MHSYISLEKLPPEVIEEWITDTEKKKVTKEEKPVEEARQIIEVKDTMTYPNFNSQDETAWNHLNNLRTNFCG